MTDPHIVIYNVSPATQGGKGAVSGMGGGRVDAQAKSATWYLEGQHATPEYAKLALKGRPVGSFMIFSPRDDPQWKYRLVLRAPNKKIHHYTVINSMHGFHFKGSRMAASTLSEFVMFFATRDSKMLPVRLAVSTDRSTPLRTKHNQGTINRTARINHDHVNHGNSNDINTSVPTGIMSTTATTPAVAVTSPCTTQSNSDGDDDDDVDRVSASPRKDDSFHVDSVATNTAWTEGAAVPPALVQRPPRKRALLVAISYKDCHTRQGVDMFLRGCLHDTHRVYRALTTKFHFNTADIQTINESERVLGEDGQPIAPPPTMGTPTHDNIIAGFDWLVDGVQPGDQLFLHLAAHGSRIRDLDGDEFDGMDEALVPLDFALEWKRNKLILDDEIFARLIAPLPTGAVLNCVIDTCHSGTLTDLKHMWDGQSMHAASSRESSGGLAACLSGCTDEQESTDASSFDGGCHGVLTHAWLRAVDEGQGTTYGAIYHRVAELMKTELAALSRAIGRTMVQEPRLSFSQPTALDHECAHLLPVEQVPVDHEVNVSVSTSLSDADSDSQGAQPGPSHSPEAITSAGADVNSVVERDSTTMSPSPSDPSTHHAESATVTPLPPAAMVGQLDVPRHHGGGGGAMHATSPSTSPLPPVPSATDSEHDTSREPTPLPQLPAASAAVGESLVTDDAAHTLVDAATTDKPTNGAPPPHPGANLPHLSHLHLLDAPTTAVALSTMVEGLSEGWLSIDDLLNESRRRDAAPTQSRPARVANKTTWRSIRDDRNADSPINSSGSSDGDGAAYDTENDAHNGRSRAGRRYTQHSGRSSHRHPAMSQFTQPPPHVHYAHPPYGHHHGSLDYGARAHVGTPSATAAPEIHVHIKNPVRGHRGSPNLPYTTAMSAAARPPMTTTTTVEEQWFDEEYVVNDDGTETVVGRTEVNTPTDPSTDMHAR
eukprot:m.207146 g.207146  ORF g.207146 m.207146 type:complete len:940 (+) comp23601_c0_seq1:1-2820(+)